MTTTPLSGEADRISRQLIGVSAGRAEAERYGVAVARIGIPLDPTSRQLWRTMLQRPRAFGFIDGGLAFLDPSGPIRQRIFIMLAILETSPAHADHFLPRSDAFASPTELLRGLVAGGLRAAVGVPLVLALRRCAS